MCKIVFLKLQCAFKSPGHLVELKILIQYVWGGLCNSVSNKFSGDAYAADLGTTPLEAGI